MPDLVVAGAGMAGLVAAAEARRLGAAPLVLEKLDEPGGSMRLSSGVVWRHREFARFRADCPAGDERLQARLFESVDGDIRWLESLGAPVSERATGNPLTTGVRFDPARLTAALVAAADGGAPGSRSGIRCGAALTELPDDAPVVLATGGFGASRELLREHVTAEAEHVFLRAAPGWNGRRPAARARGGRRDEWRPGPGLRPADARPAGPHRARRPRPALAAVRDARRRDERERGGPPRRTPGPRSTSPSGRPASHAREPSSASRTASSASACASAASAR